MKNSKLQIPNHKQTPMTETANSKRFWLFGFWILNLFVIWNLGFVIFTPNEAYAALISKPPTNLGLVGYWSMNEGTGTVAGDGSGNGNRGILTGGPTWVDGKRGKAINFDGGDDYVNAGSAGNFERTNSFTVSLWIKRNPNPTVTEAVVAKEVGSGTFQGWGLLILGGAANDPYRINIANTSGTNNLLVEYPRTNDSGWHHVVFTYNGTSVASGVFLYEDGISKTQTIIADTLSASILTATNFQIGARDGAASLFSGSIDEVRVYNRALSATEIQALYNSGAAKFAPPTDKGLVGYWSMNEGAGTIAGDGSGNGNRGTLTGGPTWVDGKRGKALSFDGSNDYVNSNFAPNLSATDDISFSFWFKVKSATHTADQEFIGADSAGDNPQFAIEIDGDGSICTDESVLFFMRDDNSASSDIVCSTFVVTDTNWHHVVAIHDVSSNLQIYIDGIFRNSTAVTANSNGSRNFSGYPFFLGANNSIGTANQFCDCSIDEVRIYNRVLSASEVSALYNSGAAKFAPPTDKGLVGYWSMNEGAGTVAGDGSGNGNRGTLTGGPTWVDGKRGKALSFDGGDDDVLVADNNSLDFGTGDMSISAWIKPNTVTTANQAIVDKTGGGTAAYRFNTSNADGDRLKFTRGSLFVDGVGSNDNVLVAGVWQHIAAVVNTSGTDIVTFYVNGVAQGSGNLANSSFTNANPLMIGQKGYDGSSVVNFNGLIDEVRIYNRALSAAEIQTLYNSR